MARSLLREAPRAELWQRGLLIDLGTPDQHKYTMGGWRTGWSASATGHATAAREARLTYLDRSGGLRAVQLRLRSLHDEQQLTLLVDDVELGSRPIPRRWSTVRFPLDEPPAAGRRRLTLRFSSGSSERPAAEVDWLWAATAQGPPPAGHRVGQARFGTPRRALLCPPGRTYAYYLQPPRQSTLVFDYAGDAGLRFLVRLTADGGKPRTLADLRATPRWREAQIDLSTWGGRAVRLELSAQGSGKGGAWGNPVLLHPGARATPPRPKRGQQAKNLIVVVIDTARQDAFAPFNPQTEVWAPAMQRLAETATRFQRAYANSNWTKPSVATIWSGLYPSTHGATTKDDYLSEDVPLVSEHLRKQGFDTAAFIANGYTSDKFGFRRGWSSYRNYIREDLNSDAEHVYADAISWLEQRAQESDSDRFFLYIQAIDPHVPYAAPNELLERYFEGPYRGRLGPSVSGYETADYNAGKVAFEPDDHRYVQALYRAEISYHDLHFGNFVRRLRQLGLDQDSLLIVSNDHGEELNDRGRYGHGHSLHEELIRSPLLLRLPGVLPAGRAVEAVVELVDLLPTALQLLGVASMEQLEGLSLLPAVDGAPPLVPGYAVSEHLEQQRSVRVGRFKLIRNRGGREELYDLQRDPAEQQDIAGSHPIARRMAQVYLGEGLGVPPKRERLSRLARPRRFRRKKAVIDPKLRRQLEALGYIQ